MSGTSVPSNPASPSPDLISITKEWASRHLEIVLPLCAAAGAAAGAYSVTIFNIGRLGALASAYDIPDDFLSSDPLENLVWVAFASFYAVSVAFFGLATFNVLSIPSFRTIAGVLLSLAILATPPYTPLTAWGIKLITIGSLFALVTGMIWVFRVVRRFLQRQTPSVHNWQRPRWIPTRLWKPLSHDLASIQQSDTRGADYAFQLVTWMGLLLILTVAATVAIGLGGRWIGEAVADRPVDAWILDGTQSSQRPVIVLRTPDYWLERPVQEHGRKDGQRRFVPVGPVVIHSYDEGPLRVVSQEELGIVKK